MKSRIIIKTFYVVIRHIIPCPMFIILLILFTPIPATLAQEEMEANKEAIDEELEQELRWLQAETYVITPSRIPEKIKKTASSITVVTDKQIRQMGAKDIADVLMLAVPSFSIYRSVEAMNLICVRGPCTTNLMMINSLPLYGVGTQGSVPYGYPQPGTNFLVELTYEF